jgi:cell division protein FtsI/penicillin-binding protein 2
VRSGGGGDLPDLPGRSAYSRPPTAPARPAGPAPTTPGSATAGSATSGPATPGAGRPGPVRPGSVTRGPAAPGTGNPGPAGPGSSRQAPVRPGPVSPHPAGPRPAGPRPAAPPPAAPRPLRQGPGTGGPEPSRLRPGRPAPARSRHPARVLPPRLLSPSGLKIAAALVTLVIFAVSLIGGCGAESSAEPTVRAFLLAWEQGRYLDAAGYTTGSPRAVSAALAAEYQQLNAAALFLNMGTIAVHGNRADADFSASVDLGEDGPPWRYEGRFSLSRAGTDWKIDWTPSVINPSLRSGLRFAVVTRMPTRAPILDSAGQSLLRLSPAYSIGVQPGKLSNPAATAAAFAGVTGLDAGQILGQIRTAPPNRFQELLILPPAAYNRIRSKLGRITGLRVHKVQRRLFTSEAAGIVGNVGTENAESLHQEGLPYLPGTTVGKSGLQAAYQQRLVGTPTTEVVVEDARGSVVSVLQKWPGLAPEPVRTTLDARDQSAAAQAVDAAPGGAAVVAVQASTGHILAVSRHSPLPAGDVLSGHYPPGGSFTIVSTAALLSTGFGVDAQIPCSGATDVGGETFTNEEPEQGIGVEPPFRVDFAHACGTAFAGLSRLLTASQITEAATRFGLGARWQLPLPGFAGSVPTPGSDAERAADTIGRGRVTVSPLAMALVAAEVDTGAWHRPILVTDPADPANVPVVPFTPQVMGTLRGLMRDTVASGAASAANLRGQPVYGQVGAAPLPGSKGKTWVNWFVGFRGGVAFAVMTLGAPKTAVAVQVGVQFLRAAGGR